MKAKSLKLRWLPGTVLVALLSACGGGGGSSSSSASGSSSDATVSYQVSLANLTNQQPMSPVVAIIHKAGYTAFDVGEAASVALERLAEGGETSTLVQAAEADPNVLQVKTISGGVAPGTPKTFSFTAARSDRAELQVTLVTMLTNTNDGFTGIESQNLNNLAVGQSTEVTTLAFDAGTEANSETSATVPGLGGTGFSAVRDDATVVVTQHGGVVSADDNLGSSGLSEAHRFDNPVLQITVTRTE